MNLYDKQKILKLRSQGLSYAKIAEATGIPKGTVKWFLTKNATERDEPKCKNCGKPLKITPGKKAKQFCCDQCRWEWWHKHRNLYKPKKTMTCNFCGKVFSYFGKNRKYCCRACYLRGRYGSQ
ncbi:MAG: helix-turn-helix domain-containing protein [Bacilli bacterium]|jgi:hypothetical protein|nr:helix-turn-helix domain-containing protein [Bacilli bacterium]